MSKAFVKEGGEEPADEGDDEGKATRGCPYITLAGFQALQAEVEHLWHHERPKVTREVGVAAAQGDRSENAEYIYGKKRLREIDRRLRFLAKRLDVVQVVERTEITPDIADKVFFGAWVTLEDEDGRASTFRIVGTDEPDAKKGWISVESPVARALLGKSVGDVVTVHRPKGVTEVTVLAVRYREPEGEAGRA